MFGGMQGTGIADWPVSYAEIEPYYTQAEWEIGISGPNASRRPLIAPMSKPYPVQAAAAEKLRRAGPEGGRQAEPDRDAQCRGHHHRAL